MPNNDYILRSDAVFALCENCEMTEACGITGDLCGDVKSIEAIPAADVEPKRRWIPVTERLPETNEKVLVYVFDPDFCGPYIEFGHWLNWLKRWGEFDDEVGDFGDYTIIAWMPLPKPPKEDKEEDHADTEI